MPQRTKSSFSKFHPLLFPIAGLLLCSGIFLLAPRAKPPAEPVISVPSIDTEYNTSVGTETDHSTEEPEASVSITVETAGSQVLVLDLNTGCILFAKNENAQIYPASLTKLLTALTALKYAPKDMVFTVGGEISLIGPESSISGLRRGDELTFTQLLDAMLLPSGNDAAYTMAAGVGRHIANNPMLSAAAAVELFVEKMNETAQSLGALSSVFTCPDGYPDPEHVSTAADLARIAAAASKNETIRASTRKKEVHYTINGRPVVFKNTDQLLDPTSEYYYPGVFGLKTGYTARAGNCMAAAAEQNGKAVLVITLGSETSEERWEDCITCFNTAFAALNNKRSIS